MDPRQGCQRRSAGQARTSPEAARLMPEHGNARGLGTAGAKHVEPSLIVARYRLRAWAHLAGEALRAGDPCGARRIAEHAVGGPWDSALSSLLDQAVAAAELGS